VTVEARNQARVLTAALLRGDQRASDYQYAALCAAGSIIRLIELGSHRDNANVHLVARRH